MKRWICKRCGVEFPESDAPPRACPICDDDRQYIGPDGQEWTSHEDMRAADFRNEIRSVEPGAHGIGTTPVFAIGQRCVVLQTEKGNVLWDCISHIDDETISFVRGLGGLSAIAISHPHFFASMGEWQRAFGGIPVYLHAEHRRWVMRPELDLHYWTGEYVEVLPGITLIQCGGHFPGSTVLHRAGGASGGGSLYTGDTISVVADRSFVTFLYSYPNSIPLAPWQVRRIVNLLAPFEFDRLYGGWWHSVVESDAKTAVVRSAARYIKHIEEG